VAGGESLAATASSLSGSGPPPSRMEETPILFGRPAAAPQSTARVFTRPKVPLAGRNPFNQGLGEKSGLAQAFLRELRLQRGHSSCRGAPCADRMSEASRRLLQRPRASRRPSPVDVRKADGIRLLYGAAQARSPDRHAAHRGSGPLAKRPPRPVSCAPPRSSGWRTGARNRAGSGHTSPIAAPVAVRVAAESRHGTGDSATPGPRGH
jgi:hypothetical protein